MIDLIRSRVRRKLAGLLFEDPGKNYYLSELSRLAGTSAGNVQRELVKLLRDGLILRKKEGKLIRYSVNPSHELFPELQALIRKTCGLEVLLRTYFKTRPEVQIAYLFGSQATGKTNRLSDVDVAVFVDPSRIPLSLPYGYKAEIGTDLIGLLKTNRVDVVLLNEAPFFLRHQVVKSGKCLFARDPNLQIRFEAEIMSRYPDLQRLFQKYRAWRKAA